MPRLATTSSAPGRSSFRPLPWPRTAAVAGTMRRLAIPATAPMGTLMRNTDRQPNPLVSSPPARTPTAAPPLPRAPHAASAAARRAPV